MERCKTYAQHLGRQTILGLVLILLVGAMTSLSAQKTNRRGMWGELGFNLGGTLSDKSKLGLPNDMAFGGNFYITALGVHLPRLNGLQVGVGLYRAGYGNPDELRHDGVHLDLRYAPFKALKRLQISTMIGIPTSDVDMVITSGAEYHTKLYGTLALGWELPKLLGKLGLSPAIGVSFTNFDYHRTDGMWTYQGTSNQATLFFRLGFRLN